MADPQAEEALSRLNLALEISGLGMWEWDAATDTIWVSPSLERMMGFGQGEFDGRPASLLGGVHPDDLAGVVDRMQMSLDRGPSWHHRFRMGSETAGWRWVEARATAVLDAAGALKQVVGVADDVTERVADETLRRSLMARADEARVGAETARERLGFLADLSEALAGAADTAGVAAAVADAVVPRLADWCIVEVRRKGGEVDAVEIRHRERGGDRLVRMMRQRNLELMGRSWVDEAAAGAPSRFRPQISLDQLDHFSDDPLYRSLLRRLAPGSLIGVPFKASGRVVGGLTMGRRGGRAGFDSDDLALAEGLAARAAVALDNARLHEERDAALEALQRTLLPPALPEVEGLELGVRYRVAEGGIDIGGDFYDVVRIGDGRWAAVIGDVAGKGPEAAAITGLVRHSVRALARRSSGAASLLADVNAVLVTQPDPSLFCTAVLALVEPTPDGAEVVVANAGHPRPYVRRADGSVEVLGVQGMLLGVVDDPELVELAVTLGEGDELVLVTDGVTEARRAADELGEVGVVEALRSVAPGSSASELADLVASVATEYNTGRTADDQVVLVIRALGRQSG